MQNNATQRDPRRLSRVSRAIRDELRLHMFATLLTAIVVILVLATAAIAREDKPNIKEAANSFFNGKSSKNVYFEEKRRGWFYYERERESIKETREENSTMELPKFPYSPKTPEQLKAAREQEKAFCALSLMTIWIL
jgi:hypothetical protein